MKVGDLMTRTVYACGTHETLNEAARIMWDHDCGCVPVVDAKRKVVGIVTDRDIAMAAYTQGLPLGAIPVERVMSPRVISCARTDEVDTAHSLMRTHEIHRIPVADSRGVLVGILSLSDIAHHAKHNGDDASASHASELAATVTAVRRRRVTASAVTNGDGATPKPPKKAASRGRRTAKPA